MLNKQSIRGKVQIFMDQVLIDNKEVIIKESENWTELQESLFRKMLQQGGKFKLQGNLFRIVKEKKIVNTKGFKDYVLKIWIFKITFVYLPI